MPEEGGEASGADDDRETDDGGATAGPGEVRVGVDVGGTFTDLVTVVDGRVRTAKTPSTPEAPERAVVTGLDRVADRHGAHPERIGFLGHGTTVATNAVLEGTWADTALVTTEGFRDVLEIGRQARPDIYDFQAEKPAPVVERDRRYEVPGRLDERGRVLDPLDEDAVRAVASDLREAGVDAVAVSLLFPFENDAHERRVAEILRAELGDDVAVSRSSAVLPEIREYERTLTTALNAALRPVMEGYVGTLDEEVRATGIDAPLRIMQSNGGVITADVARTRPVNTLLSGPAAGVRGAAHVAGRAGYDDLLTMDMGGTSCDASLVEGGDPVVATETTVGDYPVSVPSIDVHTVGAGGGSVAWIDAGGALRVGPRSAGADPGPVCYGRGGDRPTITDAHLVLGRIDPGALLGDALDADPEAARRVVAQELADPLGSDPREAAQGVLDVANANLERALRVVSVERGHDPRRFTLVAFGGAGPLHAPGIAAALDVPRVFVPRTAGVLSALGLLVSDVAYDYSTSRVRTWDEVEAADVAERLREFEREGRERLEAEGFPAERTAFERSIDLRYAGQSFELTVPVPGDLDADGLETVAERFHERHRQRYGTAYEDEPIELVTIRGRARGLVDPPALDPERADRSLAEARLGTREVVYDGTVDDTAIYERAALPTDATFEGPAVVQGDDSTTVVHPGQRVAVDDDANLIVEVGE